MDRIVLVQDDLNTHQRGALHETYLPDQARALAERFELHRTSTKRSCLNMPHIEFSAMRKQCLDRRIGSQRQIREKVVAWARQRNREAAKIRWRFYADKARHGLGRHYGIARNQPDGDIDGRWSPSGAALLGVGPAKPAPTLPFLLLVYSSLSGGSVITPSPRSIPRPALCIILVTACALANAQNLVDLDDPVYDLLARAEDRGLIARLPLLRPYPLPLVLSTLEEIEHEGNRDECRQATKLLESLHAVGRAALPNLTLPAPIHAAVEHESAWLEDHAGSTDLRLRSTGAIGALFSYSGRFSAGLTGRPTGATLPRWTAWGDDGKAGGADIEIAGETYNVDVEWKGIVTVGTESVYFQAGLTRSVFGPFWDSSAVLGAQAPAAGHFSLTYRNDWLTYTSVLLELQALYAARTDGTVYSLKGALDPGEAFPVKYVALHTAVVSPVKWLDLGLIQSVVFGSRFSPLYLLPFQIVQYTQIQVGDYDNALMGLVGRARLPGGVSLSALMYVDDWNFDEMVRGSLDSGQNKCAFQAGASWSPWFPVVENVRLGYTLVTPYMYTHSSFAGINYLNYEHAGAQLGSILSPNSDELRLSVGLRPISWLGIDLLARHVRHANGSDYGDGVIYGDGSVYDDGFTGGGTPVFVNSGSTFMTQDVIENTTQIGIDVSARLPVWKLDLSLTAGYTFEYVVNPDLDSTASPEVNHAFRLGASVTY